MIFAAIPVLCAVFFAVIHFGYAASRLERVFTIWDALIGVWCILYAVFALWYAQHTGVMTSGPGGPSIDLSFTPTAMFIMIPTMITAIIACGAWQSIHFVWVMLLAGAASVYLSIEIPMFGLMLIAPIVWNFAYLLVCRVQIRKINRAFAEYFCPSCGYSLAGLDPAAVCPECGSPRATPPRTHGALDPMPSFMPKATQYNEMFHIWFFSVLSALAGCFIMYLVSSETFEPAYAAIGFAHLIVFLPAMIYSEQRWPNMVTASILCVLFPLWGALVGIMMCLGIAAPLICSMIWGGVLAVFLRRPIAFPTLLVVGLITNAILFIPVKLSRGRSGFNPESQFGMVYYAWYIAMLFAIPLIMSREHVPPRPKFRGKDICQTCGYSLAGLGDEPTCPECGTVHHA